jgi:hypothetical protein
LILQTTVRFVYPLTVITAGHDDIRDADRLITFTRSKRGNEAFPYLPEGFLVSGKEIPELSDWYDRWDRPSAESSHHPKSRTDCFESATLSGDMIMLVAWSAPRTTCLAIVSQGVV